MPAGIDVVVLPGLVGKYDTWASGEAAYPSSTADFVKVLTGAGLKVGYTVEEDQRAIVKLAAADWWVPILLFARDVFVAVGADVVAGYIRECLTPDHRQSTRLHMKVGYESPDGFRTFFEADGELGDQVLDAYSLFVSDARDK